MKYIYYDTTRFDFVTPIARLLGVSTLQDVHEEYPDLFKVGADSATSFHKQFYDKYHAGWTEMEDLYRSFIGEEVAGLYDGPFLYQKFPTFRVHLRNNLAVGAFHNDFQFGHPIGEVNYIIPLTNSEGNASVWVESECGKGDFRPMSLQVGRFIEFNGNQLTHGNKVNDTGLARVSMDFRVLPVRFYREEGQLVSMTLKTRFREGEYYTRFQK